MRIMHIQLAGPYTEGASYQENILPKFHAKMGHEVYFLASCYSWNKGKLEIVEPEKKVLNDGVILERIKFVRLFNGYLTEKMRLATGVYNILEQYNPDFIMLHDVQSLSDRAIVKYLKKHKNVKMIVDCHTDFSNSATNWISKNILHSILWRHQAKLLEPYTEKFYGVLPARVDFLKNIYKLPASKCDLLVMGADDDLVSEVSSQNSKTVTREKYGIENDDFLIVTGGKIDQWKKQTILLMQAVKSIQDKKIKLIVFGSVIDELKSQVTELADGEKVKYIGWLNNRESYACFAAADLAVFPGRHSVFWEQVAGLGIPMIVKYWEGTTHVDGNGNVKFLYDDSTAEIEKSILEVTKDYVSFKNAAKKNQTRFLYSKIAERCLNAK